MATVVALAETLADNGALDNTIIVAAAADEAAPIKFMAPYAGCAMGEHFLYNGQARAVRLRRPDQARVRVPADVAAAAPPAGPRGLPGRRLLPALPPARARGEAQRRPRRRLADRAADHRDAGRRRVGLHPDERHLDHRRADLPRAEAVLLGRAPGDQRRHLGLARGRQRPDHADEEGRRPAEARAVPVPRARGVRAVRLRPRRRDPAHAGPRRAAGGDAEPGRAPAAAGRRGPGRSRSTPRTNGYLDRDQRRPRRRSSSTAWPAPRAPSTPTCSRRSPAATGRDETRRGARRARSRSSPTTSATTSTRRASRSTTSDGEPHEREADAARRRGRRTEAATRPTRREEEPAAASRLAMAQATSRTASRRSRTSRRSRARWRWSPPRGCAGPSSASSACGRTRARSGG